MRLNVNRVLHTPDAGENFHFEMDLSDLEFGGEKPVIHPVVVDGQVRTRLACCCWSFRHPQRFAAYATGAWRSLTCPNPQTIPAFWRRRSRIENDDIVLLDHDEVDLDDLARTAFILDMDTKTLYAPPTAGPLPRLRREPQPGAVPLQKAGRSPGWPLAQAPAPEDA